MLSSLNAYGGLSAADIMKLFGANPSASSSSTPSSSTSISATQLSSTGVSAYSVNDPATTIKAILAQAQIGTSEGGSISVASVTAAYEAQMDGSSSVLSTSVTIARPDAIQQINDAVSLVNSGLFRNQYALDPATNDGASSISVPITVTAADAININISNGVVMATAMQGASFPNGLPSMASIQRELSSIKTEAEEIGWNGLQGNPETIAKNVADAWWNSVSGNFTIVKLPANQGGVLGANVATFGTDNQWAVVMPQDTVRVTVSDTQVKD